MTDKTICGMAFDQFMINMEAFHGARAPGIVVGGLMLDTVLKEVRESPDLVVVAETFTCLPDAVQVLTSCTIGNGRLKVFDWGKFALTAYHRERMTGVRTWVVADAVAKWPVIDKWFNRSRHSGDLPPFGDLVEAFFHARSELIGAGKVRILLENGTGQRKKTGICPKCGESYNLKCGPVCSACQGMAYYKTDGAD